MCAAMFEDVTKKVPQTRCMKTARYALYIHVSACVCVYVYIQIEIDRVRETKGKREIERGRYIYRPCIALGRGCHSASKVSGMTVAATG